MAEINHDGHIIHYDEKDPNHMYHKDGLDHLTRELDPKEARVYFDQARIHGSAEFETRLGKNYTLVHDKSKGTFTVQKR